MCILTFTNGKNGKSGYYWRKETGYDTGLDKKISNLTRPFFKSESAGKSKVVKRKDKMELKQRIQ